MTQGIETRLDGETLVVRIPMRFQRRGGRKRIVAPDGNQNRADLETAADQHTGHGTRASMALAAAAR
jgi:hypothetical protein